MNKKLGIIFLTFLFASCSSHESNYDVFQSGKETKSDLIFSEIQIGSLMNNRALEIYNKSNSEINLSNYFLILTLFTLLQSE